VLKIVTDVAAAVTHLHQRGILHGDLYAHNILTNHQDRAILGDFGAASFYPEVLAPKLEPLEVRAFGCLLEELMNHCPVVGTAPLTSIVEDLHQLRQECMDGMPEQRPGFEAILERLEVLGQEIYLPH
jgi:serine/threonine protein kinase